MKALDGRHKWEYRGVIDASDVHVCRVCGETQRFVRIVPPAFLDALIDHLGKPNPYRAVVIADRFRRALGR